MPKRGKGKLKGRSVEFEGSDDEINAPDSTSNDFFYDDVDEFHASREKILLDRGVQEEDNVGMDSSEEEILGLESESDDDEMLKMTKSQLRKLRRNKKKRDMGSDIEDAEDDESGLPDSRAWGGRKNKFIGADVEDDDIDLSGSESGEEGAAKLEEIEALNLQRKMAEQLDDQDFGLESLRPAKKSKETENETEKIVKDLSKLSSKERMQLLKKKSPELLPLLQDFTEKLTEIQTVLQPIYTLLQEKNVHGKAADYINTKLQLSLNYCINIAFYLMLQAKHLPVHNHPVIKRLVQYRNLMQELDPVDKKLKGEVNQILDKLKNGEDVHFTTTQTQKSFIRRKMAASAETVGFDKRKLSELITDSEDDESDDLGDSIPSGGGRKKKKKQRKEEGRYETKGEREALAYYQMMKDGRKKTDDDPENEDILSSDDQGEKNEIGEEEEFGEGEGEELEGKRAITYQIAKNKGLTAKKKKELRNPRVKHKMKYRKAKIRRKGQVREPRKEMERYGGELSGIRAGIKRGIKLK